MASDHPPTVAAFFESYRAAFERSDAQAIAGLFAYPAHITSDAGDIALTTVGSEDEWTRQIEQLLGAYATIEVASAHILDLTTTELSPRLHQSVVHWALRTAAGDALYGFQAMYTMAVIDGALRITALAHNELPQLRACLARRQSPSAEHTPPPHDP